MVGPPYQGVEQAESFRLTHLKCLRGQRNQSARQRETAVNVGWYVAFTADDPGQIRGFDLGEQNARVARRQPVQSVS